MTNHPDYLNERCDACGGPFNEAEWQERHYGHWDDCKLYSGESDWCDCSMPFELHEDCCADCNPEASRAEEAHKRERLRGHDFWPTPKELARLPRLYATESVPLGERVIWLHYFAGACNWWLVEYDPAERRAFGYVCLGDPTCAEWGYVSLDELEAIHTSGRWLTVDQGLAHVLPPTVVERDLWWTLKRVREADLPGSPT